MDHFKRLCVGSQREIMVRPDENGPGLIADAPKFSELARRGDLNVDHLNVWSERFIESDPVCNLVPAALRRMTYGAEQRFPEFGLCLLRKGNRFFVVNLCAEVVPQLNKINAGQRFGGKVPDILVIQYPGDERHAELKRSLAE